MRYNKFIKLIILLIGCVLFVNIICGCTVNVREEDENTQEHTQITKNFEEQMKEAKTTPFGKYPQLITYTLGKLIRRNNSNMPEGDTYEDNAYTRYLRELLNIQNVNSFESEENYYDKIVLMSISDNNIPDIMIVSDLNVLENLVKNGQVEDLTKAYKDCASERINEIYNSYMGKALEAVTFDGKIMAMPGVNIDYGPNLLWLRKDWLDKLNLKEPKDIDDVIYIVKQFIEKDPGGNGKGNTIGLPCAPNITGNYDLQYQMDLIFASFYSFPQKWIKDETGSVVYGSVTNQTKEALGYLHELYKDGIIDNRFLLRTTNNIHKEIIDGRCGAFFGPWWAPNNPLMESYAGDLSADWQPYFITNYDDNKCITYNQMASNKYVVVRKGFEYPEIAVKMVSVLFDYERFIDDEAYEIQEYYANNVDPTARPITINVDYNDAYFRASEQIQKALKQEENLATLEKSYYDMCKRYLISEVPTPQQWAAYTSRITAANVLDLSRVEYVPNMFESQTETMQSNWWILQNLETEAFLKIIVGEEELDYFDLFTKQWNEQGGSIITEEVNIYIKNKE